MMGKLFASRSRACFEFPIAAAIIAGSALTVLFYLVLIYGPVDTPLLKRYCLSHAVAVASVGLFFVASVGLGIKFYNAHIQRQLNELAALALEQYVSDGEDVSRAERSAWLEAQWLSSPALCRESWVGRRIAEIIERQIKRGKHTLLETDMRDLDEADRASQHESLAIVRVVLWSLPMLGFLGTLIGISNALGHWDLELANQSPATLHHMTSGLFVACDTTAVGLVLTLSVLFIQFGVRGVERSLLAQIDGVVRDNLMEYLGSDARQVEQDLLSPVRQMADDLVEAVHQLVNQQSTLWSRSIAESQKQWSSWTATSGEQLRATLCESLEQSLSHHATQIEKIQQEAGRQVDSRWQQWQITLSDQARVMHAQQKELVRQTESIDQLIKSTCDLKKVEEVVRESFGSFEMLEQLRQTSIGVSEAVAVLASSLERAGFIRGMPVKPRAIRKFDPDAGDAGESSSDIRKTA